MNNYRKLKREMEKTISPIFMEMAAALLNDTEEDFGKVDPRKDQIKYE
ncbi:MAG: hypothetical protein PUI41_11850 [Lachnospiraceae bacterium]|nr:hypothetical protein [Lachnospiraceae bacterium]MDY4097182.1 hypothetical protein [Lachnospiraceae bacterium]